MRPMEIEFVIAPPPGIDSTGVEKIEVLRRAYAQRAVQVQAAPDGSNGFWFQRFGVPRQSDWPAAALRLDAARAGEDYWLCADPIHLQIERDRLLFDPQALADLSTAEADALVATLNAHFAPDGLHFQAVTPQAWVLRVPRELDLRIPAPADAAGWPASMTLPQGADAAWARRLAGEAQMLLHQAPLNAEREARRLWPVNSLWIWGGGVRPPDAPPATHQHVTILTSEKHVSGLAHWAGARYAPLPPSWQAIGPHLVPGPSNKLLIDLTKMALDADWAGDLQTRWLAPAAAVAKTQKLTFFATLLIAGTSLRARLYHGDLFHFFGGKSLAQYIDKSQN